MASQIEMFGLSKREIEAKFTKSEMALLGWRSHEISYHLHKQTDDVGQSDTPRKGSKRRRQEGGVPDGLPDHFFNEDGEVDLRQVTGAEAYQFMQKQGIRLPIIRIGKKPE